MENTNSNQSIKRDAGKPRLSLVPMQILWDVAAVREWATANKYPDPESWRKVESERYREALLRHVLRYIDEPDGLDEESALPHLYHVATNAAFLSDLERRQEHIISRSIFDEFDAEDAASIGERISARLDAMGMTQRQLAEKLSMTEVSVSRYVTGKREPKATVIVKIARALNTTVEQLVG